MKDSWVILANPAAGNGNGRLFAEEAARLLTRSGRPIHLLYTQRKGDGEPLARQAVEAGAKRLLVCGGDGTLAETLPALAGRGIEVGLLPAGTANDLARALGIPRRVRPAVACQLHGTIRALDLGACGKAFFATVAAFGFDADISAAMMQGQLRFGGTAGYLYAALTRLPHFSPPQVRLEGDFGLYKGDVLLVAVANSRSYGGGLRIAPDADPTDGLLDVCIVDRLPTMRALPVLPRLFWGGHRAHPAVRLERTAWLRVETPAQTRQLCADGELLATTPVELTCRAGALRFVVPPRPD